MSVCVSLCCAHATICWLLEDCHVQQDASWRPCSLYQTRSPALHWHNTDQQRQSAGSDASMFTLSLPRAYQTERIADFARIEGLPGVYMANQLDSKVFDDPKAKPADIPWSNFLQTKVASCLLPADASRLKLSQLC